MANVDHIGKNFEPERQRNAYISVEKRMVSYGGDWQETVYHCHAPPILPGSFIWVCT